MKFLFLSPDNIHLFFEVFSSTLPAWGGSSNEGLDRFKKYIKYLNISNEASFILSDDNKEIGLFLGATAGNDAYILALSIVSEFRKRGYGRVLLQKGISLLSDSDCTSVRLEVMQDNESAINLYKSEGFSIENEILNFRNEKSFFCNKDKASGYELCRDDSFTFHILHKAFLESKTWQKSLSAVLAKIEISKAELFLIKKDDKNVGYIVIARRDNCLEIVDLGLRREDFHVLGYAISSIIQNEKIVQANSFYLSDPICECLKENGFYIDAKQFEMQRRL